MARAAFSGRHAAAAPGASSGEAMSVPCPGADSVTLPAWLETVTSPSSSSTPYLALIGPPQNSVPRTAISATGVEMAMVLTEGALGRLEHGLADPFVRIVDVAVDQHAGVLAKGEHVLSRKVTCIRPVAPVRSSSFIWTAAPTTAVAEAPEAETSCASFSTLLTKPTRAASASAAQAIKGGVRTIRTARKRMRDGKACIAGSPLEQTILGRAGVARQGIKAGPNHRRKTFEE